MWPNPQESADLVTFAEEILNGKPHFLCSADTINLESLLWMYVPNSWNFMVLYDTLVFTNLKIILATWISFHIGLQS